MENLKILLDAHHPGFLFQKYISLEFVAIENEISWSKCSIDTKYDELLVLVSGERACDVDFHITATH